MLVIYKSKHQETQCVVSAEDPLTGCGQLLTCLLSHEEEGAITVLSFFIFLPDNIVLGA